MNNLKIPILLFIIACLQSCFVLDIGSKPSWDNKPLRLDSVFEKSGYLSVSLVRDERIIPLPFLFITFDKQYYATLFNFSIKDSTYISIDSIKFSIYNSTQLVLNKTATLASKNFMKETSLKNLTHYYSFVQTEYNLVIDKKNYSDDLKLNAEIFLKGVGNKPFVEKYEVPLIINKYKKIRFGSFL